MSLGSGALAAAHGRHRQVGRGLATDARGNVRTVGALKLGGHRSSSAGTGQVVAEVVFERPGDGFESDVAATVIQGPTVRADMRQYDMVVRIHVRPAAAFSGVLPKRVGMLLRA